MAHPTTGNRHPSDRFTGALLALACGDALGAPAEFMTRTQMRSAFGTLRNMVGGGRFGWARGQWTDDTAMTLCVAEGILEAPDDPVEAVGRRFLAWQKTAKDVGATISEALRRYRGSWPEASSSTSAAKSGRAAGNGSLMRTLPVALAYPDRGRMLRQAARISAMTHWDSQAEVCCAAYCLWITELLAGASLRDGWIAALELGKEWADREQADSDTAGPRALPSGFWDRLHAFPTIPIERLQPNGGYAGYVVDCLEAVVRMVWENGNPEACLINIVNLAGEADTMAAIAGGALGAHSGHQPLPTRWLAVLFERERLQSVGRELSRLRHDLVYRTPGLPRFNYYRAEEGLLGGRHPLTTEDVAALQAEGVKTIVDLREEKEWSSADLYGREAIAAAKWCGIERLNVPVRERSRRARTVWIGSARFSTNDNPTAAIYVHCRAGIERTGAVLAAWLSRKERISPAYAVMRMRANGAQVQPLPAQMRAVANWLGQA